jgi:hypothetical protein
MAALGCERKRNRKYASPVYSIGEGGVYYMCVWLGGNHKFEFFFFSGECNVINVIEQFPRNVWIA